MQVDDELYLIKTKESGHRALSSTYFNASSFIGCWSSQFHNMLLCLDNMPSIIWAQYLIVCFFNQRKDPNATSVSNFWIWIYYPIKIRIVCRSHISFFYKKIYRRKMIIFLQENDDCHDEGLAFEKRVVIQVTSFYNKVNISISLVWIIPEYANSKRKPRIRLHTMLNGWVVIRGENKKGLFFFLFDSFKHAW